MTDYAATVFGLATLASIAWQRVEAGRNRAGDHAVNEDEAKQRERALDDALSVRRFEMEAEVKRTSQLIGQVATLEGEIRDLDNELRVALGEKGDLQALIVSAEQFAYARGVEMSKKDGIIARLESELRRVRSLILKGEK